MDGRDGPKEHFRMWEARLTSLWEKAAAAGLGFGPGEVAPKVMVVLCTSLFALTALGPSPSASEPSAAASLTMAVVAPTDPAADPALAKGGALAPVGEPSAALAEADAGSSAAAATVAPPAPPPPPPRTFRVADLRGDPDIEVEEIPVGKSSFMMRLVRSRVAVTDVFRLQRAFEKVVKFDHTHDTDRIVLARQRKSRHLVGFEYIASPRDVWQAREEEGTLVGKRLSLHVERETIARALVMRSDLHAAGIEAGLEADVLASVEEALSSRLALGQVHAGAQLRFVATREKIEGGEPHVIVNALELAGGKNAVRVYHFDPADLDLGTKPALSTYQKNARWLGYYDDEGKRSERGDFRAPLPFRRVSSHFNPRRMHPVLHVVTPHNGVDFAAPSGTPVYATAEGSVRSLGDGGACGNMVQIDHGRGLTTAYCHLSRFAAGLYVGAAVTAKTLVGYVGQTGRATGPHLHFAVKRNDRFVDPLSLRMDRVHALAGPMKESFDRKRRELDGALERLQLGAHMVTDTDAGVATDDESPMLDDLEP